MRKATVINELPKLTYFSGDRGEVLHFLSKDKNAPVWNELKKFQRQVFNPDLRVVYEHFKYPVYQKRDSFIEAYRLN